MIILINLSVLHSLFTLKVAILDVNHVPVSKVTNAILVILDISFGMIILAQLLAQMDISVILQQTLANNATLVVRPVLDLPLPNVVHVTMTDG